MPPNTDALTAALPRIRQVIENAILRYQIPGAVAGIVIGGSLAWSEGFGVADLGSRRRPDHRTLFRVASITKTFTGTAIMQLRDAGKLKLDDPIASHIPEFKKVRARRGTIEQVTLRRLLTHHSGLVSEAPFDYWESLDFPPLDRVLASMPAVEVVLDADHAFKYSNLAFALLGEVVARVSGQACEKYITSRIIGPLGLSSTTFTLSDEQRARFATGYDGDPFSDHPALAKHESLNGLTAAGGLYSCVEDLARWVSFQLSPYGGRGGPDGAGGDPPSPVPGDAVMSLPNQGARRPGDGVLAAATLREMHRPQILEPDWKTGYCLPWRAVRSGDRVYLNHGGGLPGHRTTIHFDPAHRTGFIFLTNLGWHDAPEDVAVPALDAFADAATSTRKAQTPIISPAPEALRRFLGSYVALNVLFVNIEWRGGQLHLVLPPGVRSLHAPAKLKPTTDPFAFEVDGGRGAGELAKFDLDPAGNVASFALGGTVYRRLRTVQSGAGT
ncbi:MAG: beta-lactamase family protein [Chloroflexi bacterium]|nr:beta-lactamase family protein [Chloroflexota bacterium]